MFAFIEGFDDYPANVDAPGIGLNAAWNSASTLGNLGPGRFGYQALYKSLGYDAIRAFTATRQVVLGTAFIITNFAQSENWGATVIELKNQANATVVGLSVDKVGDLYLTSAERGSNVNPPVRVGPLNKKLINNTWHYIELIYSTDTKIAKVYLDGESIFEGIADFGAGGFMNRVRLRSPSVSDVGFDDMYLCIDTQERIGEARAQLLLPVADDGVQWTPKTAGPNVDMVKEERVDQDTTYNESNTPGQQDMFTMQDLPGIPRKVYAVQLTMAAKKSDSATRVIRQLVKLNGQVYTGPEEFQSANYTWRRFIMDQAPDGTPWTPEKVNALGIGYRIQE